MKKSKDQSINRPFEGLTKIIKDRGYSLPEEPKNSEKPHAGQDAPTGRLTRDMDDDKLFALWMSDVKRLPHDERLDEEPLTASSPSETVMDPDEQVRKELESLVAGGSGFKVSQTSEYVAGTGYGVSSDVARRLHKGDFSIQAHIDLHGMDAADAQKAFDAFFGQAIASHKRTVLVIHGRGLSSPGKPVLKSKVLAWLITGQWRKWVLAFASARACDGGAGATLVLLRNRPVGAGQRKRWAKKGYGPGYVVQPRI
ncbi:DNA-nicking endonuclease, Smr domain [Desulfatibacillum alkenivorans DSM 16219]|jgi:DNA-nicking Smr family endonuclease|uniref:DNA-nicking endonuclease, Smr domain n=1 Tax=Desulfatibacillum alkenivorans DSM 16219 TaxID=1121393 RepID=A0A1M6HEQ4_9BACT|nr:Smr/MutS family protein [Desulfatibacillum alkenivorans]SHJ20678.1 DNA-nicking endonuclease, Smr domain [Desulfatibacillum alkenivorans DSM 16219]